MKRTMICNIIPTPKKVRLSEGVTDVPLFVSCDGRWEHCVDALCESFEKIFACPLGRGDGIRLAFDASLPSDAYRLDSEDGITLYASGEEGLFYAMASLLLAINCRDGKFTIEIAHTNYFSGIIDGLDFVYYEVGQTVKHNVPVGYSEGENEVQVTLYSNGNLLNCFAVTEDNALQWITQTE